MTKLKILLVDDDPDFVDTMSVLLKHEGYEIVAVTYGREALDKAKKEKPDLILLDIMMPGMDGTEVCRQLKADDLVKSIPVVMLSASWRKQDIACALEAGADSYLMKPFSLPHLSAKLKEILGEV